MSTRGITVLSIASGSAADEAGFHLGDRLLAIDGQEIEDLLDVQFYLEAEGCDIRVQRDGEELELYYEAAPGEDPGWELEPLELQSCHCKCTFCFIDQLPEGLRPPLYLKDEDYRFSFLFGNYLTLVGFNSHDFERIIRLRLSPLYVSIHATDPEVRGRLLGIGKAPVLPRLQKLVNADIEIHGQIVIVPGENDGAMLQQTLEELYPLAPGLASVSVVPVGLTEHRHNLPQLRLMNRDEVENTLRIIDDFQQKALTAGDSRWVFPADELLLKAERPMPAADYYEDYPQIENGVGMVRWLHDAALEALEFVPGSLFNFRRIIWVTGSSAFDSLVELASQLCDEIVGLEIVVLEVTNQLLGSTVTVANLLGGEDILRALRTYLEDAVEEPFDAVYLPPDCLNNDGLFLDDLTLEDISDAIGLPIYTFDYDWDAMLTGRRMI